MMTDTGQAQLYRKWLVDKLELHPILNDVLFTGSRLFGDAKDDSDWDFVIRHGSIHGKASMLHCEDFNLCHHIYKGDDTIIMRGYVDGANINVILVKNDSKFRMWHKCTDISMALNLNKDQRKTLFKVMVDES